MNAATIRRWHSYIGLVIAPSVLFFALTGALQIFGLHETHDAYHPPVIIEKLSSVHKDQIFALSDHHAGPADENKEKIGDAGELPAGGEKSDDRKLSTLLLKSFFLAVALGLAASASLGLWIGLTQSRDRRMARLLIGAGTLIPLGLLILG